MILQKVDSEEYKESFINKFTNFADKAPIVISFPEGVKGDVGHGNVRI